MLEVKDVRRVYVTGDLQQTALDDVSITFRDNEFVAILGPSGSGKTTLLNVIGGLDHYDAGDLVIDGISTKEYTDRDWDTYRNNRIGFVFQSYNLIPHQTILANVELALTLSGVGPAERRERAREALEQVGLGRHVDKKPSQLSGGQMQRVAIARALVNDPEILLADEPTGALDSKTSVQIMDLLKEIASDRLVIMVTHNPELADEYATRIVMLRDGKIESDTDPCTVPAHAAAAQEARFSRRSSMSFLTALSLSFNNLMTKKGRTLVTAFAGSIGIIGIAAILALANGVNVYIKSTESDTLSSNPLEITTEATSLLGSTSEDDSATEDTSTEETADSGTLKVVDQVASMLESAGINDLKSLKSYLDGGTSGIEEYVTTIEYTYNVTPQVFLPDTGDGVRQVNPDSSLSSVGDASSLSTISSMFSSNSFSEMPSDTSLYEWQYDVLAGHWPEKSNECVLVTDDDGTIGCLMLYTLGLRDTKELEDLFEKAGKGEKVSSPGDYRDYSYDEIIGVTFKLVNACDYYEYDSGYGMWMNMSEDESYVKDLVSAGEDLTVVGVVKPVDVSKGASLTAGINYTPALTKQLIAESAESEIVKQQLAEPDVDAISGKTFSELKDEGGSSFDTSSLFSFDDSSLAESIDTGASGMIIDTEKLKAAIANADLPSFPEPKPEEIGLQASDATLSAISSATYVLMVTYAEQPGAVQFGTEGFAEAFNAWLATNPQVELPSIADSVVTETMGAQDYLRAIVALTAGSEVSLEYDAYILRAVTEYTDAISAKVSEVAAANVVEQMSAALASAASIDTSTLSDSYSYDLSSSDLSSLVSSTADASSRTYAGNLRDFGYADLGTPYKISIYPVDYDSKDKVKEILDSYNDQCMAAGEESKVITYNDLSGLFMSGITTIVDMVTYVLIAFVAISLVVSSIMIGVITYISVLERRKEIGILRALGASKANIGSVFNAETVIEGLISGVFGVLVTYLICIPVNLIVENMLEIQNIAVLPPLAAVVLVAVSVLLTFVSGLVPSSQAARQDPVEALRGE